MNAERLMARYDVRLVELGSVPLAVVRHRVSAADLATVVPKSCGIVWDLLRAQNVKCGRHVAIYWDRSIRLEVGVELEADFEEREDVVRSATPAGLAASAAHFGPYGQLVGAHNAIRQWCAERNYRLAGPNWEVYGHWQSEWNTDPSKIRTDVFYQVAAAAPLAR